MNGGNTELLAHLAIALARYSKERRRNGLGMSEDLLALAEFFQFHATTRQGATPLGDGGDLPDAGGMTNHPLLTKREAAAALRVSVRTLERLVVSGALPVVHMGRVSRVRRTDLENYIESLGSTKFQDRIETKDTA